MANAADLQEMAEMGDLDADMMMDDEGEASLFWSLKIPASGTAEIEAPEIPGYIIHVTKACFGPKVTGGSRSVVMCAVEEGEDEKPNFSPIACLKANNMENVDLDLIYGESAVFKIEGNKPCDVWLTGHLRPGFDVEAEPQIPQEYLTGMGLARGDEFEELDGDGEDIKLEDDDESPAQKKRKMNSGQPKVTAKANDTPNGSNNNNKSKKNKKSPKNKPVAAPDAQNNNNKNKSKKQKQKNKQSPKQKPATPAEEKKSEPKQQTQNEKKKKQKYKKKNMSGGMQYKEVREGNGSAIKKGDRVFVYYIGQLANQSIFDKTLSGEGFAFTVGGGEVIKGWDMGLIGMKGNGSKRKLWIPPKLGYGNESQEKIPANSTLIFTIEVKKVE